MNNRVAYLISKKLSEEIDSAETQELNECLASDPSLYQTISLLEITWHNIGEQESESTEKVHKLINQLRLEDEAGIKTEFTEVTPQTNYLPFSRKMIVYARWVAAALIIALIFLAFPLKFKSPITDKPTAAETENKIETKSGNRTKVILNDGTSVWLNGESKLSVLKLNDTQTREVFLRGEAYFEVHSNPSKPFIIHTENTHVKVTGTSLNVRDYPGENKAETSLISGKAEVFSVIHPEKIIRLQPNQKVVFRRAELSKNINGADTPVKKIQDFVPEVLPVVYYPLDSIPVEKAWINDQLTFFDEPFREVANKMEKWYGVKIVFENSGLEKERLNGKIKDESLEEALEALQFILKFNYSKKNQTIIIKSK